MLADHKTSSAEWLVILHRAKQCLCLIYSGLESSAGGIGLIPIARSQMLVILGF